MRELLIQQFTQLRHGDLSDLHLTDRPPHRRVSACQERRLASASACSCSTEYAAHKGVSKGFGASAPVPKGPIKMRRSRSRRSSPEMLRQRPQGDDDRHICDLTQDKILISSHIPSPVLPAPRRKLRRCGKGAFPAHPPSDAFWQRAAAGPRSGTRRCVP